MSWKSRQEGDQFAIYTPEHRDKLDQNGAENCDLQFFIPNSVLRSLLQSVQKHSFMRGYSYKNIETKIC